MTSKKAFDLLDTNEDLAVKAVEECQAAMLDAYTRTDNVVVTVWLDDDHDVFTSYTFGYVWTPGDVILASFRGAGGDAMEEEEAREETWQFGLPEILEKLLWDIREEKALANW
jgi:hypothetical protein